MFHMTTSQILSLLVYVYSDDTDENISPVENPIFVILTKIHL